MNNEPVAIRYDFDGYGYQYMDSGSGSDWQTRVKGGFLYTHPAKTLTDEEWNKAFDFYCETDEGVLKFDLELRDEWKKEQLIRWKEAIRKAQEK